ncbi:glycoside hydrolase family 2 [Opitutaceae bacterium EW11]|nr:glycoside hydrolase family 2 [Opitutaceae bacterium EW11]
MKRFRFPASVLALALSLAPTVGTGQAGPPHWPLQQQPGPTGDPRQDPSTFPGPTPAWTPRLRVRPAEPALTPAGSGDWLLRGAWKFAAAPEIADTIREISTPGYTDARWLVATVPGTLLASYVDAGVYPEPTYGLNNLAIPESLARQDYWYRTEFVPPETVRGKTVTLTFNGINYAADVWLNGVRLGTIQGAFRRGVFDVTALLRHGAPNALGVRISPPPHPGIPHEESLRSGAGPNGGSLLFDGPNFFCTEGWDWIPGIRDRCTGIWQDVVLHVSDGPVIGDVQVITDLPLPETNRADVTIALEVANRSETESRITVRGEFEGVSFEHAVTLPAKQTTQIRFAPAEFPQLHVKQPRLWWPNGYGAPELYHLKLSLVDKTGTTTDMKSLRFGIREISYELSLLRPGSLELERFEFSPTAAGDRTVIDKRHEAIRKIGSIWHPTLVPGAERAPALRPMTADGTAPFIVFRVNGQRILVKGGNWGLDEALKRVPRERLKPYLRLERDAHLTMVRNWCGQNTEEAFYDLCDEYGLLVWNDFWASTQEWNQQPGDPYLWLDNAEDTIKRYRNHPSIAIWCGRNEGVPPPILNEGLDERVRRLDGTRYYQPSSREISSVTSGPWEYAPPAKFFDGYTLGFNTEMGLPSVPTADAIRAGMPPEAQWPISDTWAYHDWHTRDHGVMKAFADALVAEYGAGTDLDDFCRKAQMINYVGHRAMFEGMNAHLWQPSSGRLIWMSHPAWLSMEWQLYSADYDTHGSYYGAKKACEPLHVQFNADDRRVVAVNTTLSALTGATVTARLYDLEGRQLSERSTPLDVAANQLTPAFALDETPAAKLPLYFLKLTLTDHSGRIVSDNFYWQTKTEADHQVLNTLPRVALEARARAEARAGAARISVEVHNPSTSVVLLLKPTLRDDAGNRILPTFASDGCFSLLPGEARSFTLETSVPAPRMNVTFEGWNNASQVYPVAF